MEIPWAYFHFDDLGHAFYEAILGMQLHPQNTYLVGLVGICLNRMRDAQEAHELGKYTEMPDEDLGKEYNRVLTMIQNLRLSEMASLSYSFLKNHGGATGGEFQLYAWWRSSMLHGDEAGRDAAKAAYLSTFPDGRFRKTIESQ